MRAFTHVDHHQEAFPRLVNRRLTRNTFAVLAITFLTGCGGDGLNRHQTKGRVTYRGEGVEYGTIIFEPDAGAGEMAPTTYARIENGEYVTDANESPVAGPYTVRVMGFDKARMKPDASGQVNTPLLFPQQTLKLTIPAPDGRFDVTVPDGKTD